MLYQDKVTGLYFKVELVLEGVATIKRIPDGLLYRLPSFLMTKEFVAVDINENKCKKILKSKDREWLNRLVNLLMPQVNNTVRIDFSKMDKEIKENKDIFVPIKETKEMKPKKLERIKPKKSTTKKQTSEGGIIKVKDLADILELDNSKIRRILRKLNLPKPYEWSENEKDNIITMIKKNI